MRFVYLLLGSITAILFIIKILRGEKYFYLVENLQGDDYPLKSLYCVGFSWSESKAFALKGKIRQDKYLRSPYIRTSRREQRNDDDVGQRSGKPLSRSGEISSFARYKKHQDG